MCDSVLDKLKHTRPGHTQNVLELESFKEDERLCVVRCLKDYITKTEPIRDGEINCCYHKLGRMVPLPKTLLAEG